MVGGSTRDYWFCSHPSVSSAVAEFIASGANMVTKAGLKIGAAILVLSMAGISPAWSVSDDAKIKSALDNAYSKVVKMNGGKNADYIPALAKVDSKIFGIALVTTDGRLYTTGDVKSEVSIQSISKVFTLAL